METKTPRDHSYLKRYNTQLVLSAIRTGSVSRADLTKLTGISPATVTRIVADLINAGLVCETVKHTGGLGRRATLLALVKDATYTLGINISADYIGICLVNYGRRVLDSVVLEDTSPTGENEDWLPPILEASHQLAEKNHIPWEKVQGIGVGGGGIVDKSSGQIAYAPSMKMQGYPLREKIQELFCLPVVLEHDVKAGLLGEVTLLPSLAEKHVVLLSVGAGVGSAAMANGSFVRGNGNVAGEIGHTVMDPHGELCSCGRKGCLQTFIGERYIAAQAAHHVPGIKTFGQFIQHYRLGADWSEVIYNNLVTYLSIAVENLACIYNPQTIILGGHMFTSYPEFFPLVAENFARHAYLPVRKNLNIIPADASGVSYMLGAAVSGMRQFEKATVETMALEPAQMENALTLK